jgi:hypothetical protein
MPHSSKSTQITTVTVCQIINHIHTVFCLSLIIGFVLHACIVINTLYLYLTQNVLFFSILQDYLAINACIEMFFICQQTLLFICETCRFIHISYSMIIVEPPNQFPYLLATYMVPGLTLNIYSRIKVRLHK